MSTAPAALVVGSDGLIGSNLSRMLEVDGWRVTQTTRRPTDPAKFYLDLLDPLREWLPDSDVTFVCAGVNGTEACEGDSTSWRVNVDGVIAVARHCLLRGDFVIYVSSLSVEWSQSMYARQRAQVEMFMMSAGLHGDRRLSLVVRSGRITSQNAPWLASYLSTQGKKRAGGLVRFTS